MAKLAPTQVEQLQSIGAYLRQVRQEQGLALDVLANQIFIRPALLQALETGQGGELPEAVFIQGFIRRYAEALGLDGQAIAQEFRVTPVDVLPTPDLLSESPANGTAAANGHGVQPPEPRPPVPPPVAINRTPRGNSPLPLLLSLGALVAVLGLGVWGLFGRSGAVPPAATNDEPVAETPADEGVPEAVDSDAAVDEPLDDQPPAPEEPLEAPVVVSASLSERSWLSVVADGENLYEGTAESGFEETWTAQTSLVIRTGNAGGVELSVNGDPAVVAGESGVVRTLTLTPDSGEETVQAP